MAEEIIAGLDIGTTKIAALIGECDHTGLNVLGVGVSPSDGLRRGVVVNIEKTVQSIVRAVEMAEHSAGVQIDSVLAGIAGEHIQSVNSRGAIAIPRGEHGITRKDIHRAFEAAKALQIPLDRELIHVLAQEFIVDDQRGIPDPDGMFGVRLEVLVHIVTAAITSAQNLHKCVTRAGLEVRELVLESYASSFAALTEDEKELGMALLDLGGGTTDLAVFYEGSIRHSAIIPIGGKNITNDIAIGLRTPLEQAEEIKKNHSSTIFSKSEEDHLVEIPGINGRASRKIAREQLVAIVGPRMEEILTYAHRELKRSGFEDLLGAGVALTGGGALLKGTVELAEQIFGMPAKIARPEGYGGMIDEKNGPMLATGLGLMLYGAQHSEKKEWRNGTDSGVFNRFFGNMKRLFEHFS